LWTDIIAYMVYQLPSIVYFKHSDAHKIDIISLTDPDFRRYVITELLAKGTYNIQFKSSLICPETDCLGPNFESKVIYKILMT